MFYGIGAQKSGTTWLYKYFDKHPQVFVPRVKELDYFWNTEQGREKQEIAFRLRDLNRYLDKGSQPAALKDDVGNMRRLGDVAALVAALTGRISYDRLFDGRTARHRAYGEISPSYGILSAESYGRMLAVNPQAKFIFIMRDPVKRFWSSVRMLVARRAGTLDHYGTVRNVFFGKLEEARSHPVQFTDYAGTIERLESVVPAGQIHYMFFEDLFSGDAARGHAAVRGLTGFLGVDFVAPELETKVWATDESKVRADELDAEMKARARVAFAPVYEAMAEKFGGRVPPEWAAAPRRAEVAG